MTGRPHTQGLGRALNIADWRDNKRVQRDVSRRIVQESIEPGANSEEIIERYRRAMNYYALPELDRNRIRVMIYDVRTILGGWSRLDDFERGNFLVGRTVASTLAKKLRGQ